METVEPRQLMISLLSHKAATSSKVSLLAEIAASAFGTIVEQMPDCVAAEIGAALWFEGWQPAESFSRGRGGASTSFYVPSLTDEEARIAKAVRSVVGRAIILLLDGSAPEVVAERLRETRVKRYYPGLTLDREYVDRLAMMAVSLSENRPGISTSRREIEYAASTLLIDAALRFRSDSI